MIRLLENSTYFGVAVSLLTYGLGMLLRKRFPKVVLCNPLLVSVVVTMLILICTGIPYEDYQRSAGCLGYFLTPAMVSLAIPLYRRLEILKRNWKAVFVGILCGALSGMSSVLGLAYLFRMNHTEYVTLLPKSITTAIGMELSAQLGGYASITAAIILITGLFGNVISLVVFKALRITDPIARGLALGTASHAVGTARAMELGETEGAVSGLSIVVAGIITVAFAPLFAGLL